MSDIRVRTIQNLQPPPLLLTWGCHRDQSRNHQVQPWHRVFTRLRSFSWTFNFSTPELQPTSSLVQHFLSSCFITGQPPHEPSHLAWWPGMPRRDTTQCVQPPGVREFKGFQTRRPLPGEFPHLRDADFPSNNKIRHNSNGVYVTVNGHSRTCTTISPDADNF